MASSSSSNASNDFSIKGIIDSPSRANIGRNLASAQSQAETMPVEAMEAAPPLLIAKDDERGLEFDDLGLEDVGIVMPVDIVAVTGDPAPSSSVTSTSWRTQVSDFIAKSQKAYEAKQYSEARYLLRQADLVKVRGEYQEAKEDIVQQRYLAKRATTILEEAKTQATTSSDTQTVFRHLTTMAEGKPIKEVLTIEELEEAMMAMDRYDEQVDLKSNLFRERVVVLGGIGVISIVAWFALVPHISLSPTITYSMAGAILLFALIGATVSSFRSSLQLMENDNQFIADVVADRWVLGARVITGVMLSILATTLVHTEFLNLGTVTPILLMTVAIVSGFGQAVVFDALDRSVTSYGAKAKGG